MTERDWSDDPYLADWRPGRLRLPFTVREKTQAERNQALWVYLIVTGVLTGAATYGVLIWAGYAPYLHVAASTPTERGFVPWLVLACTLGPPVLVWLVIRDVMTAPLDGPGHPWTFNGTESGLTLTTTDGVVVSGTWSEWRVVDYQLVSIPRNVKIISHIHIALGAQLVPINLRALNGAGPLQRAIAQRIALPPARWPKSHAA